MEHKEITQYDLNDDKNIEYIVQTKCNKEDFWNCPRVSSPSAIMHDIYESGEDGQILKEKSILSVGGYYHTKILTTKTNGYYDFQLSGNKNDVFPKLEMEYPEPILQDLFCRDIARNMCLYFWDIIHNSLNGVILSESVDDATLRNLIRIGYGPEKAAAISEALRLIRNGLSMRDLKNMSLSLHKSVKEVSGQMNLERSYLYNVFLNIRQSLSSFERLRMPD